MDDDNVDQQPQPGQVKAPPLTSAQRKQRRLDAQETAVVLADGIDHIFNVRDGLVSALSVKTGRSEAHINLLLGVKTTEKKSRGTNAFNAWRASEIARLNEGT